VAHYILLMTLSPDGRERLLEDPNRVIMAEEEIHIAEVTGLGMYAVLGAYDFVAIVQAPDNDAAARYSIQLGVRAGAHIETLPAVPVGLLHDRDRREGDRLLDSVELGPLGDAS
jgi:uncharacterized protein with GYD domain